MLGELVWQFRGPAEQQVTWVDVLEYELQIRKRAMRWVRQGKYTVKDAIATAMKDQEVRTTYFVTQLACAKPRKRERSPQAEPRQQNPNTPRNNQSKGKGGKGKGDKGKGKGGRQDTAGTWDTQAVNSAKRHEKTLAAVPGSGKGICIKYNKGTCTIPNCRYEHACMRCGEYGHRIGQCPKPKVLAK